MLNRFNFFTWSTECGDQTQDAYNGLRWHCPHLQQCCAQYCNTVLGAPCPSTAGVVAAERQRMLSIDISGDYAALSSKLIGGRCWCQSMDGRSSVSWHTTRGGSVNKSKTSLVHAPALNSWTQSISFVFHEAEREAKQTDRDTFCKLNKRCTLISCAVCLIIRHELISVIPVQTH